MDQQFLSASTVPFSSPEVYSRAGSSLVICAGARGSLKNPWRRWDRGLPIQRPHTSQQVVLYPGLSHWELYTVRACSFKPRSLPEKHDQANDSAYQFVPQLYNGIDEDFYNCVLWNVFVISFTQNCRLDESFASRRYKRSFHTGSQIQDGAASISPRCCRDGGGIIAGLLCCFPICMFAQTCLFFCLFPSLWGPTRSMPNC